MRKREGTTRPAFSLVELLIGIAIIAILVGILLPALGHARRMGQDARCRANLNQIAKAFHHFAENHNGRTPDEESSISWDEQLLHYIPGRQNYLCPSDKTQISREVGFSYSWRNSLEVKDERSSVSRVALYAAVPNNLILIFELKPDWHRLYYRNAAQISTAVRSYDNWSFVEDLEQHVY